MIQRSCIALEAASVRSHYGGWYVQIIEALLQAYPHIDQPTDTPAYHAYDLKYKDTLLQHVSSVSLSLFLTEITPDPDMHLFELHRCLVVW